VKVYSGTSDGSADDTPYRFYVALHATDISTIESLAEAIDARHGLPASYSRQVAQLAVQIAFGWPAFSATSGRSASPT